MRRPIIAGNWKMNKTVPEAVRLAKQIKLLVEEDARERVEVVLCPPFTALHAVREVLDSVKLGAQNVHDQPKRLYGEVSVPMLRPRAVVILHSRQSVLRRDRRDGQPKGEGGVVAGPGVIICVGETLHEKRKAGGGRPHTSAVPWPGRLRTISHCYEPVWAIGTGENATGSRRTT